MTTDEVTDAPASAFDQWGAAATSPIAKVTPCKVETRRTARRTL
ncbi:MAG: hypothetical protein ACRET7_04390 [Burkholderiales bacterium]